MQRTFRMKTALLACLAALASGPLFAQGDKPLEPPSDRAVTTEDGVKIWFTYYKSNKGRESPVVVLLHENGGNRFNWKNGLAEKLHGDGFAVIAVDLRQHGDSRPNAGNANQPDPKKGKKTAGPELIQGDYEAMARLDMEEIKNFIFKEHQQENLNMNKMGIVGAEMGASVAAYFAAIDWGKEPYQDGLPGTETPRGQDVHALVLISPQKNYHGIAMPTILQELRNPLFKIAFLFCVGKNDPQDRPGQTKSMFEQTAALGGKEGDKNERIFFRGDYAGTLRGNQLVTGPHKQTVEGTIVKFLENHLKNTKDATPWRDRQSKLDKKE